MSKIYLITAIFIGIYGVYFLANKHWFFGIVEIVCSLINALLFISEIKAGEKDDSNKR